MAIFPVRDSEEKKQNLQRKRQNLIIGTLVIVGIATFVFSIFQITETIDSPFKPKNSEVSETAFLTDASQEEEIVQLKTKDTDNDGLNDFDELYIYKTSPYVRDSDSDGLLDDFEIESGSDPNCPKDQNCQISQVTPLEKASINDQGTISSEDLRTTLKDMGAPANLVDTMDDATLKQVYEQTLAETGLTTDQVTGKSPSNLEELVPADTSSQAITIEALQSMTATQLRELLKQSGIDEATLSQVDDASLEAIYQQSLGEQLQSEGL